MRPPEPDQVAKLRDENMQLRIDVEVRKQLINQAAGEITRQRERIETLLINQGALQSQLLQLGAAPTSSNSTEYRSTIESSEGQGTEQHNSGSVDNSTS